MISIIIPVYQVEKYIRKCLDSVLCQTYADLEIILVDDGSKDACPGICDAYAKIDSRIRVIHQENAGLSAARNSGIEIAGGEYIGFIDSDDYIEPTMYEKLYAAAESTGADIVICGFQRENEAGKTLQVENIKPCSGTGIDFIRQDGIKKNYAWNKLFRRELFESIRFPVGKTYEDVYIMQDIFAQADNVTSIADIAYHYLIRNGSITYINTSPQKLDLCESTVNRIAFLVKHHASFEAVNFHVQEYCRNWLLLRTSPLFADYKVADKLKKLQQDFRWIIIRYIKHCPAAKTKLLYTLMALSPMVHDKAIQVRAKHNPSRNALRKLYRHSSDIGLSKAVQKLENQKYDRSCDVCPNYMQTTLQAQAQSFFHDRIECIYDSLKLSANALEPTLIVVEKNERGRMELFFEHYRKMGIRQFVIIDNGSTDGTLDFLRQQENTRIYQTLESFKTFKKEGWIERILALTGYNRWYLVVDADELLDYPGSEHHSISELIQRMHAQGYRRLWGMMIDMYSRESLFGVDCSPIEIPKVFRYFDKDSYALNLANRPDSLRNNDEIYGGPRYRLFDVISAQSKQSLFYFDKQTLYANCHYLYPRISWEEVPCCFVLRHYKYLASDKGEYENRVKAQSFYNNSKEYNDLMREVNSHTGGISFYYEGSACYEDSQSLKCLPYLQAINW